MKKNGKTIAIVLVLIMSLSLLVACAPEPAVSGQPDGAATPAQPAEPGAMPAAPAEGDVAPPEVPEDLDARFAESITIILANSPIAVIDPFNPSGGVDACGWVYNLIFDRLLYQLPDGEYAPNLALRYETDDFQTFTFFLRDDVYFHNGERFTAHDVVWTAELALASPGTPAFNNWRFVDEAIALDDFTVQLILGEPNVDFAHNMSQPWSSIVNANAMAEDPATGVQIGTGAFYVYRFVTNNYVIVQRNDNYWGDTQPITQRLYLQFVPEQGARTIMLLNGEADMAVRIADEDVSTFVDHPDFQVFIFPIITPNAMFFNLDDPIVGDYYFRRAVAHAIDREEMTLAAVGEFGGMPIMDGTKWGWDTEFRNDDIPGIPFDLDLARYYLEKSPYNGETIEIATAIAGTIRASEVIQMQLARIGINIAVNVMDTPSLNAYTLWDNNQAQIVVFGTFFNRVASSFNSVVYPGGTGNRMRYDNPVINDMIHRANASTDQEYRRELYMEMQRILAEDMPYIPLFWRLSAITAVNGIGGFPLQSDMVLDFRNIFLQLED